MNPVEKNRIPDSLTTKENGKPRHVGFEIEFAGLSFDSCIRALKDVIGDNLEPLSAIETKIVHPEFGDFMLELDWQYLKQQARGDVIKDDVIRQIADIAGKVVPLELVFPPIEMSRLDETNDIVLSLANAGASGTDESFLYAFGVHINTEIPDLSAGTVQRYLAAYCILQDYLVELHNVNAARQLSPYVDLYSSEYIVRVLDYEAPSIETIIDDYLALNPTRNRALDMLPMFCEIDEPRVRKVVDDDRIKRRPTFHYRLPNSAIGTPGWSLMSEWNRWGLVECLASDESKLDQLREAYKRTLKADQFSTDANWIDHVRGIEKTLLADAD